MLKITEFRLDLINLKFLCYSTPPRILVDLRRRKESNAQSESEAMLGDAGPSAKIADGDVRLSPCNYLHISVITRQKIEIRVSMGRRRGFATRDRVEEKESH